ncbi:hypothetical protein [Sinorhizobium chiapasense]|uniref:Uncharacterized protein n=1 Tax=Sinorhizobium chiapasense TaxID=501572 RepID=A0ABZ2BGD6_9HYPH
MGLGRFADLPRWAKLGSGFVAASLIVFLIALGLYQVDKYYRLRENFDAIYNQAMRTGGSQFQSSHNRLLELPQHIRQSNDGRKWADLSNSFSKHVENIQEFYKPISECLSAGTCWPRELHGEFCRVAAAEALSVEEITRRLQLVLGININLTNDADAFGGAFGPSFTIPRLDSLKTIADGPCRTEVDLQRKQRMAARSLNDAKAAWVALVERGMPVEMRDFPFDFPDWEQVVSAEEIDAAIRKAADSLKSDIRHQLCEQQQDMLAGSAGFQEEEKEFPGYYLSPKCRLEIDGSRKCTWWGFYKNTQRLLTGLSYDADEERQIKYLSDMFDQCPVPRCSLDRKVPSGGQNALGFTCKALLRQYTCSTSRDRLAIELISCFDAAALKIGTAGR